MKIGLRNGSEEKWFDDICFQPSFIELHSSAAESVASHDIATKLAKHIGTSFHSVKSILSDNRTGVQLVSSCEQTADRLAKIPTFQTLRNRVNKLGLDVLCER